jgi:CRP/FNR family cyclic AMP-dependent transcriptional regulator
MHKTAARSSIGNGEFFGEGCLAGQTRRMATATALTDCASDRTEKSLLMRILHEHHDISQIVFHE